MKRASNRGEYIHKCQSFARSEIRRYGYSEAFRRLFKSIGIK